MRQLLKYAVALILATGSVAYAAEAQPLAQNPVVEKRLNAISENLRCLVCQNESLAGSRAELAEDLRREVRHLHAVLVERHDGQLDGTRPGVPGQARGLRVEDQEGLA